METRTIQIDQTDLQQLAQLARVIAEGEYKIKGDAIHTVSTSLRWLGSLADRMKNAKAPEPVEPVQEEVPVQSSSRRKGPK